MVKLTPQHHRARGEAKISPWFQRLVRARRRQAALLKSGQPVGPIASTSSSLHKCPAKPRWILQLPTRPGHQKCSPSAAPLTRFRCTDAPRIVMKCTRCCSSDEPSTRRVNHGAYPLLCLSSRPGMISIDRYVCTRLAYERPGGWCCVSRADAVVISPLLGFSDWSFRQQGW